MATSTSDDNRTYPRIKWYRCPIDTANLRELTRRSDAKGLFYALGNLVPLAITGYLSYYFFVREIWLGLALALWLHGTIRGVAKSAHHELAHGTVFKSKWLNALFQELWDLLIMSNYHHYKLSHTYHHLYTLHQDGDGEVALPNKLPTKVLKWLELITFDLTLFIKDIRIRFKVAFTGRYDDEWSARIFTPKQSATFKRAIVWDRIHLGFHVAVAVASVIFGLWIIPVLVTLGNYIGKWYIKLIGATMHTGLRDNVADFRLCCRTIKLDPFSGFIRWNMQYHIEHHMFAAVPCYNLGKLYRAVASDMPERRTLVGAWKEMLAVQRRQRTDPEYQFDTSLPSATESATQMDPLSADIGDIRPKRFVESPPKSP